MLTLVLGDHCEILLQNDNQWKITENLLVFKQCFSHSRLNNQKLLYLEKLPRLLQDVCG